MKRADVGEPDEGGDLLDRADARAHVAALVRTVVQDWGFRYLKLDFINAAARPHESVYR